MLCPHSKGMDDEAFLASFNRRTAIDNIPLNGGMDLTSRCNLKCRHCYICSGDRSEGAILPKADAIRILDESAAAGCLFFLITGGEPLLHPDFDEIYRRAKELGLFVTVFTNGTLIDEQTVKLFCDYTPLGVEVSIYGATPNTHDSVTGVPGSFLSSLNGLKMLKNAGVKVSLKTIVMTLNEFEFEAMPGLAENLDVPFRMDAALFPGLSGDSLPVDLRVAPDRAVECEFLLEGRRDDWRTYLKKIGELDSDGSLYVCGAGRTSFHITADNLLQPCLMTPHINIDLSGKSFKQAWDEISGRICGMLASPDNPCLKCPDAVLCDSCPGFFMLETGDENRSSDYLCRIAEGRARAVRASGNA